MEAHELMLCQCDSLQREMMAELDPDLAAQGPKSDASESQSFQASLNPYTASWMVISVKFTGLLKTEVTMLL
jgi:hypothetical protein